MKKLERQYRRVVSKINPTCDEVDSMGEDHWMNVVLPRKIFEKGKIIGKEEENQRIINLINKHIDFSKKNKNKKWAKLLPLHTIETGMIILNELKKELRSKEGLSVKEKKT